MHYVRTLPLAAALAIVSSYAAAADDRPSPFMERPSGPGTETGVTERPGDANRVNPGFEAAGLVGVGYGAGFSARLGYTYRPGLYVGGSFTGYTENAWFIGAEVGYKLFPSEHWELRPYLFGGPGFTSTGSNAFERTTDTTVLALQPGFIGAYHFGRAYVGLDARGYATPLPGAFALFAGAGVAM